MSAPLVSVVIPCYKQAHYLPQSVESVLKQTYKNVELIVVDDGSPDSIDEVMAAYVRDPRVCVIKQDNQGLASARNNGAAASQGVYLQFLDADDWIHPEKLARQVPVLDEDQAIGLVYSDFYMVYNEHDISDEWSASKSMGPLEPEIFNTLWLNNCIANMTVLLRREWFDRASGFDTTKILAEDWEMWLRLSGLGCRVKYLPDRLGYYRQHKTSMMQDGKQPLRDLAVRQRTAERFPEQVAAATDWAVRTLNKSWQEWVDNLQQTIRTQDERIAFLEREAYGARAVVQQEVRTNARRLYRFAQKPLVAAKGLMRNGSGSR